MRKLALTVLIVLVAARVYAADPCEYCSQAVKGISSNAQQIESLKKEYEASSDKALLPKMMTHLQECVRLEGTLTSKLEAFKSPPVYERNRLEANLVLSAFKIVAPIVADEMVKVADLHAKTGTKANKEVAKQLYRTVITGYTGNAFKSYVKRAEFGLEDLKSIPDKPEPKAAKSKKG